MNPPVSRAQLRRQLRQRRRALSRAQQRAAARHLQRAMAQDLRFIRARHIAFYLANDGEIDPAPLMQCARRLGKHCYLPVLSRWPSTAMRFQRLTKGQRWPRALGHLGEMKRTSLQPYVITFHAPLRACEQGQRWQRDLGCLDEMRLNKLDPDLIAFSAVSRACEQD